MTDKHKLWVEKYRPQTLDEYIFHDERHRIKFNQYVEEKTFPHLLLSGIQGSGKTTMALILIHSLELDETDVLTINASDENSVDVMRDKIKAFVTTHAWSDFKVVHLSEADYITPGGQAILRMLMEDYADHVRFILTCNYEHKIIPALRSRLAAGHYRFKTSDKDDITEQMVKMLCNEKVHFELEILDKYVAVGGSDVRKTINLLQQNTHEGKLLPIVDEGGADDYKFELLDLIARDKWLDARKLCCANVSAEEWEDLYRFLYENLHKSPTFTNMEKWEAAIVIVADHLYKHALVADPEINAAAMFIRLAQV